VPGRIGEDHRGTIAFRGALLKEKHTEAQPQISRDGRYMAYIAGEWGKLEIYVCPFPEVDKGRWQISTGGGDSPLWSPNGRELFYRNGDAVVAVPVETEPAFKPGKSRTLFRGGDYVSTSVYDGNQWDISPDGARFLMLKKVASGDKPNAAEAPRKINIVLNWTEELKQRVPVK
jgi:eukaryotic-like serine/threonine-protein kinase